MTQHTFVLSRRVGREPGLAERALTDLTDGDYAGLTLRGPFERRIAIGPWVSGPSEREALGALHTGRRSPEPVEVELGPWARDAVELRVRPKGRPERWTSRRQARFFEHAHQAIDELARALERATPELPASEPVRRSA
jgi:hypothetical protein